MCNCIFLRTQVTQETNCMKTLLTVNFCTTIRFHTSRSLFNHINQCKGYTEKSISLRWKTELDWIDITDVCTVNTEEPKSVSPTFEVMELRTGGHFKHSNIFKSLVASSKRAISLAKSAHSSLAQHKASAQVVVFPKNIACISIRRDMRQAFIRTNHPTVNDL